MSIGECFECGQKAVFDHHVIPKELGGTKTVPLCSDCHGKVHDKDLTSMKVLRDQSAVKRYEKGIKPQGIAPVGYKWEGKNPNKYIIIDLYADWCGPCMMMKPFFHEMARKYPNIAFVQINTDYHGELSTKLSATALPTILFIRSEYTIYRLEGFDKQQFISYLNQLILK